MASDPSLLENSLLSLRERWREYRESGDFQQFVEFALALNSVTEHLNRLKLPGLLRQCEGLENMALALFGDGDSHPIKPQDIRAIERQIETLVNSIHAAQPDTDDREPERRSHPIPPLAEEEWLRRRVIWIIAQEPHGWSGGLSEQLNFFGFRVRHCRWSDALPEDESPLVALLAPGADGYGAKELCFISDLRERYSASQLFCLSVPKSLEDMVALVRAGADVTIQAEQPAVAVLGRILELIQSQEQDAYRVLVVEDSSTAVAMIQRALSQHGIDSHPIADPRQLLEAVEQYQPDLVLMDMYMPHCNGVEATRVLRQIPAYQALPVIYLSSETDVGMQVEALRLGGDQFLTKPCNPVLLAAVVKTKIERYREMQRSSQHDSLTGLLNHSATKGRLSQLMQAMDGARDRLCVAMMDIDHFKSINDTFGHPVGDQVIRSLAWLLKGRLRTTDLIGRYGGEEFMVVLRNTGIDEAHAVLDRIRQDFATLPHAHASGTVRATFSAGLAAYPRWNSSNAITEAADDALRDAKRLGRNRIERAPD